MKDSLQGIWGKDLIREWPKGMPVDKSNDVPHCQECEHCTTSKEGKRGDRHDCEIGWEAAGYGDRGARHIPGRYVSTSPDWCPKRKVSPIMNPVINNPKSVMITIEHEIKSHDIQRDIENEITRRLRLDCPFRRNGG